MQKTKQQIISVLKENGSSLSTAEIVSSLSKEYDELKNKSDSLSKQRTGQLHRKILYHINLLVESGILRLEKHGEKGAKFFSLNLGEDEKIIEINSNYGKRITIQRPEMPVMPIEGYEKQGIVLKFEPNSWIDKLNSIVVMCNQAENAKSLHDIISKAFSAVNDCICLENFESIINKGDTSLLLKRLNSECEDYGKKISVIVNINNLKQESLENILGLIIRMKNIDFIYSLEQEELEEKFALMSKIVSAYAGNKRPLYIKNNKIQKAPYFIGRAGPYRIGEREWQNKKGASCIACSQSCIIIDVDKFYSSYGLDVRKFTDLLMKISRSFLSANSMQRRKAGVYFKNILQFDKPNENELLDLSRNYIRFWNFGLLQPNIDQALLMNMINEAKKEVDEFSMAEETIYNSCGMSTRFRIALSNASKKSETSLSSPKFKKIEIQGLEDIYKPKTRKEILGIGEVTDLFNGGNDVTFHRTGNLVVKDIIKEISVIMANYSLPFFSYDFKSLEEENATTD